MGAPPDDTQSMHSDAAAHWGTLHICAATLDGWVVSELCAHLAGVRVTHAGMIALGTNEEMEHARLIDAAAVVVLLVSSDFARSKEHQAHATRALARRDAKTHVVPVLIRAFDYKSLPYGHLRMLP